MYSDHFIVFSNTTYNFYAKFSNYSDNLSHVCAYHIFIGKEIVFNNVWTNKRSPFKIIGNYFAFLQNQKKDLKNEETLLPFCKTLCFKCVLFTLNKRQSTHITISFIMYTTVSQSTFNLIYFTAKAQLSNFKSRLKTNEL